MHLVLNLKYNSLVFSYMKVMIVQMRWRMNMELIYKYASKSLIGSQMIIKIKLKKNK